jgi:septum site-determining protein MinC
VSTAALPQQQIRFRGRSFLALVLAPETPLAGWMEQVDAWAARSPGFFLSRPIVLDVTGLGLSRADLTQLVADLHARDIRVMGVEGADAASLGLGMPPALAGGREAGPIEPVAARPKSRSKATEPSGQPPRAPAGSLVIDAPVRSGQSVIYTEGDVTVMGSIASGAEVIAGGSIHVYGAIRGRAIAGSVGNARARIFCRKLEAELLAIDGLYKTADDMPTDLRGRPVQAWLDGESIKMTILD